MSLGMTVDRWMIEGMMLAAGLAGVAAGFWILVRRR